MTGKFLKYVGGTIGRVIPEIKEPQSEISFRKKLLFTFSIIIIFLLMYNLPLIGVQNNNNIDNGSISSILLAQNLGTLASLGIEPIIFSYSIMLAIRNYINVDLSYSQDKALYRESQKSITLIATVIQATFLIIIGTFGDLSFFNALLIFLQLFFFEIILILLDESSLKGYGFGSIIFLLILISISNELFGNLFCFWEWVGNPSLPKGVIIAMFYTILDGNPNTNLNTILLRGPHPSIIGLIITFFIFLLIVYIINMYIEIPMAYYGYSGEEIKTQYPISISKWCYEGFISASVLWFKIGRIFSVFLYPLIFKFFSPYGPPISFFLLPFDLSYLLADPLWSIISFILLAYLTKYIISLEIDPEEMAERLFFSGMRIPGFRDQKNVIDEIIGRVTTDIARFGAVLVVFFSLTILLEPLGLLLGGIYIYPLISGILQYGKSIQKGLAASKYPGLRDLLGLD